MRTSVLFVALTAVTVLATAACSRTAAEQGEALAVPVPTAEIENTPAVPAQKVSTTEITSATIEVAPAEVAPAETAEPNVVDQTTPGN